MLIAFSGLPGTGKTTIARALATRIGAVYLRIDTIEQALRLSNVLPNTVDVGPSGDLIAARLASDNLALGRTVVADSVNVLRITRLLYGQCAAEANAALLDVETVCSDPAIHRHRIETRIADIVGHRLPSWAEVVERASEPWDHAPLRLDTARLTVDECVEAILVAVQGLSGRP